MFFLMKRVMYDLKPSVRKVGGVFWARIGFTRIALLIVSAFLLINPFKLSGF